MEINLIILPILIFLSRIADVTIGTVRIILVSKGKKFLAPLLGFFEVLIWLAAIQQIMTNLTNIWLYLTYAAGFATGNFIGILLEEKLCIGKIMIRIITQNGAKELIQTLKEKGYRLTIANAEGRKGKVKIIFSVLKRKKLKEFLEIVHNINPKAFYTIEDIKFAKELDYQQNLFKNHFGFFRKGR